MTRYVILVRNPSNGKILGIRDEGEDYLATFEIFDEAQKFADSHPLCNAWPFDIVEAP